MASAEEKYRAKKRGLELVQDLAEKKNSWEGVSLRLKADACNSRTDHLRENLLDCLATIKTLLED